MVAGTTDGSLTKLCASCALGQFTEIQVTCWLTVVHGIRLYSYHHLEYKIIMLLSSANYGYDQDVFVQQVNGKEYL